MRTQSDIWINPVTAIRLFVNSVASKASSPAAISQVIKDRNFRATVEAWSAAMYLIALEQENSKVKHFLQKNQHDPPDFYGLDLFKEAGLLRGYIREIEVFEYAPETKLSLEEEVTKKVRKLYGPKTVLVCHIRKTFRDTIGHLHEIIGNLTPKNEIWIIGGSEQEPESPNLVAQIFPNETMTLVDVAEVIQRVSKPDFIQGTMGKSSDMVFEPTGKTVLLTPEFELKE